MGRVEQPAGLTESGERRPAKVAQRRFVRPHDAAPPQNTARGLNETVLVVAVARATNVGGEAIQLPLIGLEAPRVSTGNRPPVVLIRLPDGIVAPAAMRLEHRELMLEEAVAPNVWTQPVDERLYGRIAQVLLRFTDPSPPWPARPPSAQSDYSARNHRNPNAHPGDSPGSDAWKTTRSMMSRRWPALAKAISIPGSRILIKLPT